MTFCPAGEARSGVELRLIWREGKEAIVLGHTDAEGKVRWTPGRSGEGRLMATVGDVEHVADIAVYEPRSVLGFVLPWLLAALILLVITQRARRRDARKRALATRPGDGDPTSGPE